jgi:hypothetical protein
LACAPLTYSWIFAHVSDGVPLVVCALYFLDAYLLSYSYSYSFDMEGDGPEHCFPESWHAWHSMATTLYWRFCLFESWETSGGHVLCHFLF